MAQAGTSLARDVNEESIGISSFLFAGPTSSRLFASAGKLDHLAAYQAAVQNGRSGRYLRSSGLYPSLIDDWRRPRDVGVLAGK